MQSSFFLKKIAQQIHREEAPGARIRDACFFTGEVQRTIAREEKDSTSSWIGSFFSTNGENE